MEELMLQALFSRMSLNLLNLRRHKQKICGLLNNNTIERLKYVALTRKLNVLSFISMVE